MAMKLFIAGLIGACGSFLLTGCSVIFFTLGAVGDASRPDEDTLNVYQVMRLKSGDSVSVTYGRGISLTGVYVEMGKSANDQYAEQYKACQLNNGDQLFLPSLGGSIVVNRRSPLQASVQGNLLGFDPGIILVQVGKDTESISLESVRSIELDSGKVVGGKTLKGRLQSGRVPFVSTLQIQTGVDTHRVALSELKEIRVLSAQNSKLTNLLWGAALDIIVLATFRVR